MKINEHTRKAYREMEPSLAAGEAAARVVLQDASPASIAMALNALIQVACDPAISGVIKAINDLGAIAYFRMCQEGDEQ